MDKNCNSLCSQCQYRTVEFIISFSGPDRVRSGEICGLELPGYPITSECLGYEVKRANRVLMPSAAQQTVALPLHPINELELINT